MAFKKIIPRGLFRKLSRSAQNAVRRAAKRVTRTRRSRSSRRRRW